MRNTEILRDSKHEIPLRVGSCFRLIEPHVVDYYIIKINDVTVSLFDSYFNKCIGTPVVVKDIRNITKDQLKTMAGNEFPLDKAERINSVHERLYTEELIPNNVYHIIAVRDGCKYAVYKGDGMFYMRRYKFGWRTDIQITYDGITNSAGHFMLGTIAPILDLGPLPEDIKTEDQITEYLKILNADQEKELEDKVNRVKKNESK